MKSESEFLVEMESLLSGSCSISEQCLKQALELLELYSTRANKQEWIKVGEAKQAPTSAGIYAIYADGKCLYVGESGNVRKRLKATNHPIQYAIHLYGKAEIWFLPSFSSQELRRAQESSVIEKFCPQWNDGNMPQVQLPLTELQKRFREEADKQWKPIGNVSSFDDWGLSSGGVA